MTLEELRNKLDEVEISFPVNTLSYKGTILWPLVRLHIIEYSKKQYESKPKQQKLNWKGVLYRRIFRNLFTRGYKLIIRLPALIAFLFHRIFYRQPFILSLSAVNGKSMMINHKAFSKFTDSIGLIFPQYQVVDILRNPHNESDHSQSLHLSDYAGIFNKSLGHRQEEDVINYVNQLNPLLQKTGLSIIQPQVLIRDICQMLNFRAIFKVLFYYMQPKAVFIGCFYTPYCMALSWVANQKDIPCIELQHGQQGDHHSMYTGWKAMPEMGYKLIPKYFAMWGEQSTNRIAAWAERSKFHKVQTTGNPWLALHKSKTISYDLEAKERALIQYTDVNFRSKGGKAVLVSLQPISDQAKECFPVHLMEMMSSNKNSIFWYVRLHPKMLPQMQEIIDYLDDQGIVNYNLTESTQIPLYELFKHIDFHITLWSSVAYEALSFGVPSVIIHTNGLNAMKDYIEKGLFFYAATKKSLEELLLQDGYSREEESQYILGDLTLFREKIEEIIQ